MTGDGDAILKSSMDKEEVDEEEDAQELMPTNMIIQSSKCPVREETSLMENKYSPK